MITEKCKEPNLGDLSWQTADIWLRSMENVELPGGEGVSACCRKPRLKTVNIETTV